MPNWCEGNIRIRGKIENVVEWFKNELLCCAKRYDVEMVPPIVEDTTYHEIFVETPDKEKYGNGFYIKDSRRCFIGDYGDDILSIRCGHKKNDIGTFFIDKFRQAWTIDDELFVEFSKKYGLDFKIFGWECGMCFSKEIEIINGELVNNITTDYNVEDWIWDCPNPNMGG